MLFTFVAITDFEKKINHLQKKEKSFLKEQKTVKGIKKSAIKNSLTFQKFKETLFLEKRLYTTFQKIQSKKHVLKTVQLTKQSLTSFDDKRYLLPCGIHSYSYYSVLIQKNNGQCIKCMK